MLHSGWNPWTCHGPSNSVQWPLAVLQQKMSLCPRKSISPPDRRYKREVYKTVDDISANCKPGQLSFFLFWISLRGGFVFVQLSLSWEKQFKNLWCHHNVKYSGWAGTRGQGQQNEPRWAYSAGYITTRLENFLGRSHQTSKSHWNEWASGFKSMAELVDTLQIRRILIKFFGACKNTSYRITLLSNHANG